MKMMIIMILLLLGFIFYIKHLYQLAAWGKAERGILLPEAIIALAIIGIVVSIMLGTQSRILQNALVSRQEQQVRIALNNYLTEGDEKGAYAAEAALPNFCPEGTIRYEAVPTKIPALGQIAHTLLSEVVTAVWQVKGRSYTLQLKRIRFQPSPKKEEMAEKEKK